MDSKTILAQLCAQAPSSEIRNCLRDYSNDHSFSELVKRFNRQKIGPLTETLAYLKPLCLRTNLSDYTKEGIVKNLISRIENLLPDTCLICNNEYTIKLDDPPILPCEKCGQESHLDCLKATLGNLEEELTQESVKALVNPFNLPGWSFNCLHCKKRMIPSPDADVKASVLKKEKRQPQLSQSQASTHTNEDDASETAVARNETPETAEPAAVAPPNPEIPQAPTAEDNGVESVSNAVGNESQYPPSHPKSFPNICSDYLKNSCSKGGSCKKNHPPICQNLIDHGLGSPHGCDGRDCHELHPTICRNSLRHQRCMNTNCKSFHIKGTARPKKKPSQDPVTETDQGAQNEKNTSSHPSNQRKPTATNKDDQGHFLEHVRLLKSELLEAMDMRFATLKSEMVFQPPANPEAQPRMPSTAPQEHPAQALPQQPLQMQTPMPHQYQYYPWPQQQMAPPPTLIGQYPPYYMQQAHQPAPIPMTLQPQWPQFLPQLQPFQRVAQM